MNRKISESSNFPSRRGKSDGNKYSSDVIFLFFFRCSRKMSTPYHNNSDNKKDQLS